MVVIKHRAPNGALRPVVLGRVENLGDLVKTRMVPTGMTGVVGHKAPSAKRCIKTVDSGISQSVVEMNTS